MILIGEVLVSEDIVEKNFACNLNACKGACCIEGDYGAPLTKNELLIIEDLLETVFPYLPEASQNKIKENGFSTYNEEVKVDETALMDDGACVFMGYDELGITFCGIEKAYYDGKTTFKKPISCHLYPVRVKKNEAVGFEALNYDKWDICSAACDNGNKKQIRIYEFAKEALIRQYGEEFYTDLDNAAKNLGLK
jgi:hypothetical protein